jgi:uncharacterized protein
MLKVTTTLFLLLLAIGAVQATGVTVPESIDGYWEGIIARDGKELRINVDFQQHAEEFNALISIPDLYIVGYKLTKVRYEAPILSFELSLSREPENFEGMLQNGSIIGNYTGRLYKEEPRSAIFRFWRAKPKPPKYTVEELSFQNGDVRLAGTLFKPFKKGPRPAIVLFHGSGPQTRDSYLRFFADLFARHGFAALIYDKRGTGVSTGEIWYKTGDQFDNLVDDALAGVRSLLDRPEIDSRKIGLWGLSQGGWLAPLAVSRSKEVAFLMIVSGGGVTPAEQEIYDDKIKLKDKGFPPDQVAEAVNLLRMADDVIRGRVTWEHFAAARAEAQKKEWYALLDRYPVKLPQEDETWRAGSKGMDFDPTFLWEHMSIPVLAIFGEFDKSTPARESAHRIEQALQKSGNKNFTIKIYPKADHGLWVSPGGDDAWDWDRPALGWLEQMVFWLQKQGG